MYVRIRIGRLDYLEQPLNLPMKNQAVHIWTSGRSSWSIKINILRPSPYIDMAVPPFAPVNLLFVVPLVLLVTWGLSRFVLTQAHKPLPPGPPRLPVIGNLHQAPELNPWRTFQQWSKQYGPVIYLRFGLQDIVVLNNAESATDLLDKKGSIYSSRPHIVMGGDCLSKGMRLVLMMYGSKYRKHQRLVSGHLNIKDSQTYRPLQDLESRQLIYELLSTNEFAARFHRYSSSFMFSLLYGKRLPRGDEPEVKAVGEVIARVLVAARVGTWAVDALPILNYLPSFMAPWKRTANEWHAKEAKLFLDNITGAQKEREWNYSKLALGMKEAKDMKLLEVAYDMGTMYEAGTDTTAMALEVFILACLSYPDFQKKAQKELDEVVGTNTLPSFEPRPRLPYIDAVVKETLRWRPVSAGGIPHAVTQDDEYIGHHIPNGATVIGNHWAISLDENVYPDPYAFKPERWIENPGLPLVAFGFGRRICTGQHVAKNSLYINIARMLWAFDISHAIDEGGERVEVDDMAMTQGFNSRPQPFEARFTARDGKRKEVVERVWREGEKDIDALLNEIGRGIK